MRVAGWAGLTLVTVLAGCADSADPPAAAQPEADRQAVGGATARPDPGSLAEQIALLRSGLIDGFDRFSTSGHAFDQLVDDHALEHLAQHPEALSGLGLLENSSADVHSGRLNDTSLEALAAMRARYARWREELSATPADDLTAQQQLTREVALVVYDVANERAEFDYAVDLVGRVAYPIEHMQGPQTSLPRFMNVQHRIADVESAERYVERLRGFEAVFDGALARARMQHEHGVVPPRFVLEHVLTDARIFMQPDAGENALVVHLAAALEGLETVDRAERQRLVSRAARVTADNVYPAFKRLIEFYEALLPNAHDHGVWAFPDGERYYSAMLRSETTTDLDAATIHRMGVDEVARIEAEMDTILQSQGLHDGTPGERTARLGQSPEHLFSNDAAGRAELIEYLESILEDMAERQQAWFGRLPAAELIVQRVPEYAEARQTIAYYGRAAMDGSRPGVYFINLRDTRDMPRWSLPSLTYHEAIPGHHLQVNLTQEMEGLPLLRRLMTNTAYREGWALYAEQLAWEMGAYDDDPLGNLGRLQYEMWRAVRMVVDTGIHAKRWTREEAIDYFVAKTGMSLTDATVEIERYFVLPGNAPAYKLGMMTILSLRERAVEALGEDFDIAAYHDEVLRHGDVPLSVLERIIDRWIDGQRSAS